MSRQPCLIEEYPEIAAILAPEFAYCAVEDVETVLRQRFGVESIESFGKAFRRLGRSAKRITRIVPAAMPMLRTVARTAAPLLPVAGQVAGTIIGGPAGAMVGGAVGNMAGQSLAGGPGHASARAAAMGPVGGVGGLPASAKLLNVLGRPEILQALTSMALGRTGNPHASVGGREVPVAAIANLIGSLAQQSAEEYRIVTDGTGESLPDYLTDGFGVPCCDIADADQRAEVLYELLTLSDSSMPLEMDEASAWPTEFETFGAREYDEEFQSQDDADLGEIWANEALEWE